MGKVISFVVWMLVGLILLGCDNSVKNTSAILTKKELRVGVSVGPYNDLFNAAIKPVLERDGYKIKLINFSGLLESNVALSEGTIDLNVAQHMAYLDVFNQQRGTELVPVVHVPSVPAAIFSDKFGNLDEVQPGAKVAIPQDPSNAARAYKLLEKAGWIKLREGVNPILANKKDVVANRHDLKINEVDSANIPRMMADVDFAVMPGSIVYSAGIKADRSLLSETIIPELEIMVVVNKGAENSEWAAAIKQAYQSPEFKTYMSQHNIDSYWILAAE